MSYVSKNPRFTTTSITDSTTGSISSPPSGADKIINRNGVLYLKNSAGGETPIGSSSGGKNYLAKQSDASAAVGTVSLVAAGGNISVSGTFPNVSSAWYADAGLSPIAISPDNTLRGTSNYLTALTSFDAAGAVYVQTPAFNIDGEDLGKALAVQFDVAGNTTANDWDVVAVRYTSAGVFGALIPIAGIASTTTGTASAQVPTGTTTFRGFFITGSTASDVYSIRWRRRAGAVAIRFDNLIVGPNSVMLGTAITDWQSYTPTGSWTANTTYSGRYMRVGNDMLLEAKLLLSGAPTSASLTVNLPTGLTINTSNIFGDTQNHSIGEASVFDTSANEIYTGTVGYSSTSAIAIFTEYAALTYLNSTNVVNATQQVTFATGDTIYIRAKIPITGWSSNVTMADRAVEEYAWSTDTTNASAASSFGYGPSGVIFPQAAVSAASIDKTIQFTTPILATDVLFFEVSADSGATFSVLNALTDDLDIQPYMRQTTGVNYGVYVTPTSVTQARVRFGKYKRESGGAYGAAGSDWGVQTTRKWRVRKVSGGAVGFPVGARNVIGDTTGTAVPAGYIGEVITSSVTTATNVGTTGQFFNLTSITLTPGTYLINAAAKYNRNAATFSSVDLEIGFSATTGNSSTGLVTGVNLIEKVQDVGLTFTQTPISMPTIYLRYDGTTATIQNGGTLTPTGGVFYLKGYCGVYSAATPQYYCTVTAVRIA